MKKAIVICLDGCDPAYLTNSLTPNLDVMAAHGQTAIGTGVVPSVTNVNHTSMLTQTYPEEHGIASNYWYDPATGQGEYVEDARYLRRPTVFGRLKEQGYRTSLIVTKQKLLGLLDSGADVAVAVEAPSSEAIAAIGPAQPIYSAEIDYWTFDALAWTLREHRPDFVYATTTDYIFHTHGPEDPLAQQHMSRMDERLGRIVEAFPEYAVYLTADHGMADKSYAINPSLVLIEHGIRSVFVPPIKDRYELHHGNMGGVGYLYVDAEERDDATAALLATPGIERVLTREEAAGEFHLPGDRIGDLVLLADERTVFGELPAAAQVVSLRSHGSPHERSVPILAYRADVAEEDLVRNMDVIRLAMEGLRD
jgi:phosphonoacetate hydrolase